MKYNVGDTLQGGKFRITAILGSGGFGITYLAEHTIMAKYFAIKQFYPKAYMPSSTNPTPAADDESMLPRLRRRFIKEARALESCEGHPGIVRIRDVFTEPNGDAFYSMDYIEGASLQAIIDESSGMPADRVSRYINQVGEALIHLHSCGMLHLDVKPSNILIRQSDDRAILIDFGLAHRFSTGTDTGASGSSGSTSTLSGLSEGFSAIEQYSNNTANLTKATDVYALAATAYCMLTGKRPAPASEIAATPLKMPSRIDLPIGRAIACGMKLSIAERPQSVRAFLDEFNDVETEKKPDSHDNTVITPPRQAENVADTPQTGGTPTVVLPTAAKPADKKPEAKPVDSKPNESTLTDDEGEEKAPTQRNKLRIALIVLFLLLVAGAAAWWWFSDSNKSSDKKERTESPEEPIIVDTELTAPPSVASLLYNFQSALASGKKLDYHMYDGLGLEAPNSKPEYFHPKNDSTYLNFDYTYLTPFYYGYNAMLDPNNNTIVPIDETQTSDIQVSVVLEGSNSPSQMFIIFNHMEWDQEIFFRDICNSLMVDPPLFNDQWGDFRFARVKYNDCWMIFICVEDSNCGVIIGRDPQMLCQDWNEGKYLFTRASEWDISTAGYLNVDASDNTATEVIAEDKYESYPEEEFPTE